MTNKIDMKQLLGFSTGTFEATGLSLNERIAFLTDPVERADELVKAFRDRLAEIHVSGYRDGHVPLYETQQDVMLDLIRGLDTPIILEGKTSNLEAMKQEYQYVQSRLHG